VVDPIGNFTALWRDERSNSDAVYSANLAAVASSWGANIPIAGTQQPANTDTLGAPVADVDAQGTVYAVWHSKTTNDDTDIYYTSLGLGKSQWHTPTPITVDDLLLSNQTNPVLVIADDGALLVLWEDDRNSLPDGTHSQIFWSERKPNSTAWRAPAFVHDNAGDQSEATLAFGGGRIYAVWVSRDGAATLKTASKTLTAPAWSAPTTVTTLDPTLDRYDPDIAVSEDGTITVVWADRREQAQGIDVFAIQKKSEESGWLPVVRINDDSTAADQVHPRLAAGANSLGLAWEDSRLGDTDIFVAWQATNTATWSTNVRVNQDASGFLQSSPDISIDAQGNTTIVWTDSRTGSTAPDIYSRFISAGARFQFYLPKMNK
jgi:hypothetical protein